MGVQDGGIYHKGLHDDYWVRVRLDYRMTNQYRIGATGKFDLCLAPTP